MFKFPVFKLHCKVVVSISFVSYMFKLPVELTFRVTLSLILKKIWKTIQRYHNRVYRRVCSGADDRIEVNVL